MNLIIKWGEFLIDFSNSVITIIAALVSLSAATISIFSTLNYDSFDRKLMPRNKSAVTYMKQVTGIFLITIPLFIITAYIFAFLLLDFSIIRNIFYIIFFILLLLYLLSMLITFITWCYLDLKLFNFLRKGIKIYEFNNKWKTKLSFTCIFIFLILMAHLDLSLILKNTDKLNFELFSTELFYDSIPRIIVMGFIIIILLLPIYEQKNLTKYVLMTSIKCEEDLLREINDEPIQLEYSLNDTVAIYSAMNQQYKIIRRMHGESPFYEVYKFQIEKAEQHNDA
ncbi:hypothetical protein SAMN04487786_0205 [Paenisporosarcina quisquiliarum]|nr:hypothetical protein SAMN04487786_0205 [Paenisporosarcina quisquiliarum]